jgi:hypothetical protein
MRKVSIVCIKGADIALAKSVNFGGRGSTDDYRWKAIVSGPDGLHSSGAGEAPESEALREQGFELVFDETPAEVLATVNRAGFHIPPSGSEYRDDLNAVMGMNVAVLRADGGSGTLSCFPG